TTETNVVDSARNLVETDSVDYSDSTAPAEWPRVMLKTTAGNLTLALNPEQKQHTENFLKLVKSKYYNGQLFHRVIKDFMIQSGDPKSVNASPTAMIGDGGPNYTVPSEIKPNLYHFRGALAAARQSDDVNPMKNSSGSQFFIVTGTLLDDLHLKQSLEAQAFERFRNDPANQDYVRKGQALSQSGNMAALQELEQEVQKKMQPVIEELFGKIPSEVKQRYAHWGGSPSLDNNYTVFGKLVSGYNVLSAIEKEPTGSGDRPKKDVKIIEAFIPE
ncbi:MAG: peptidylprolyl isomerase, partial [Bacteroidetes bacterium]|nr:peptidylprolyl isomerase [Bacteroidota bacterium]